MTPTISAMTQRLASIASAVGCEPREVSLTAVASASLLLDAGPGYKSLLTAMSQHPDPTAVVRMQWHWWQQEFPYLRGHMDPITGWLDRPKPGQGRVLGQQLAYLAQVDLLEVAERPVVSGDLLGQVLAEVNAPGNRARGPSGMPSSAARIR